MRKTTMTVLTLICCSILMFTGCSSHTPIENGSVEEPITSQTNAPNEETIELSVKMKNIESGLSAVLHSGDDRFEAFLQSGGASSDSQVVTYLSSLLSESSGLSFSGNPFGCSTLSVQNESGEQLFGRNFDWNNCDALIVKNTPDDGYSSISTVNTNFIQGIHFSSLPDEVQALIAIYAPLDGMNEKGLCVSVNMIQDSDTIEQNTDKPDLTTTTAVRLLLNKASTVAEALSLLSQYDLHASMGYMVHFAIADASGNSVAVEYIDNQMTVTETKILTNFYVTEGNKYGIGTEQSHTRYEILEDRISTGAISTDDVRDALSSVSKKNFGEFESTEWSIVFNQTTGEVHYYHRENYEKAYVFSVS